MKPEIIALLTIAAALFIALLIYQLTQRQASKRSFKSQRHEAMKPIRQYLSGLQSFDTKVTEPPLKEIEFMKSILTKEEVDLFEAEFLKFYKVRFDEGGLADALGEDIPHENLTKIQAAAVCLLDTLPEK